MTIQKIVLMINDVIFAEKDRAKTRKNRNGRLILRDVKKSFLSDHNAILIVLCVSPFSKML